MKMSSRKYRASQNMTALFLATVFVAHNCALQFFPIYLKNLNFSATEVGIIRMGQTWISALLVPASFFITNQLRSVRVKKFVMSVFLVPNITLHICLIYIPPSNMLQDVTHCHGHTSFPTMERTVDYHHNKEWDHFKVTTHIPSWNSNVKTERPITDVFHTNDKTTTYLNFSATDGHTSFSPSMVTKQNSLPRVIQHNTEQNVSNNLNVTSHKNFKVVESSTMQNNLFPNSIKQSTKNSNFFHNLRYVSFPVTENSFLPVTEFDTNLVSTVNHRPKVMTNDASSTFLNRTLLKIHSAYKTIPLNEKWTDQKASTAEKINNSTEKIPDSGLGSENIYNRTKVLPPKKGSITGHIIPMNKIWHHQSHVSQSEPRNAHLGRESRYFKQHSEQQNIPATSKNNTNSTKFGEVWLPRHSVIPWVTPKYMKNYYAKGTSSYSRQEVHPAEGSSDAESTNELTADTAVRVEDALENAQESESKKNITIKPADMLLQGKYQNSLFHLLRKYKSGRNSVPAEQDGKFLPTTPEEKRDVSVARRMRKYVMQQKETDCLERHPRIKRVSNSARYKSQEAVQFSTNASKELSRTHSTQQHYRVNVKHRRHKSVCSKSLNCRETQVAFPVHGTTRKLMRVDSSNSVHDDHDDTNIQVDKVIFPWSFKNISGQLLNITIDKLPSYWSTTFSTVLLLAVFTDVFSTASTATSNRFLQCQEITEGSGHWPVILQNSFPQVFALLGWGLFGCPLLAGLVLAAACSFQPRVFLMLSTGLFVMTVLELCVLQLPGKNRHIKLQDCVNKEKQGHLSLSQRFGYGISACFTGFAMACNSEFIQWHIETLHGFPYNYQLLYCSYVGIGTFSQAMVRSWLQRKQLHVLEHVEDCTNLGNHDVGGNAAADGMQNIGTILLGFHFLAASLLDSAWISVFLGILQGSCAALMLTMTTSHWWTMGYGLGSLFGGIMVGAYGSGWLFWVMAGSMFLWSAMVTLCGGMMKCVTDCGRRRASYSQLVPAESLSDDEEVTVYDSEDWLEKALGEEQEVQRGRNMSCPT